MSKEFHIVENEKSVTIEIQVECAKDIRVIINEKHYEPKDELDTDLGQEMSTHKMSPIDRDLMKPEDDIKSTMRLQDDELSLFNGKVGLSPIDDIKNPN